jgi:hypothetical protein
LPKETEGKEAELGGFFHWQHWQEISREFSLTPFSLSCALDKDRRNAAANVIATILNKVGDDLILSSLQGMAKSCFLQKNMK